MGVYIKILLILTCIGLTAAGEVYFIMSFLQVNYSVDMLLFLLEKPFGRENQKKKRIRYILTKVLRE